MNAILLGNGLNRALKGVSWDEELKKLREEYGIETNTDITSYPLEYERIEMAALRLKKKETEVRRSIGQHLPQTTGDLLKQLIALPVHDILTTNYDYNLEATIDPAFCRKKTGAGTKETKFSLNRCIRLKDKRIWHIHGEQHCPASVCIGYEQYCAYMSRIHEMLLKPREGYSSEPYLYHYLKHRDDPDPAWPVMFFTHDIHIIGLSLSTMEMVLWWLLDCRKRLMLTKPGLGICNQIHFYYAEGTCSEEIKTLLKTMDVRLHTAPLAGDDWRGAYSELINIMDTTIKEEIR